MMDQRLTADAKVVVGVVCGRGPSNNARVISLLAVLEHCYLLEMRAGDYDTLGGTES
jgi:hypothetical protein